MAKWRQSQIEKFINLVEQNPCLYNARDAQYLDRAKKAKVYEEMLDEMNASMADLTTEKLRSKWKNLRTQYMRELRAQRAWKNSGRNNYVPKLWCFQQLSFLSNYVEQRASLDIIGTVGIKPSNHSQSTMLGSETDTCDASYSSEKQPSKRKMEANPFEDSRKDIDGFSDVMPASNFQQRRKYSWLGDLVTAQMDEISPGRQLDAAWDVQCLMRKLVCEGTRQDNSVGNSISNNSIFINKKKLNKDEDLPNLCEVILDNP